MSTFVFNSSNINAFHVGIITETILIEGCPKPYDVIDLFVNSLIGSHHYRVFSDDRYPDLNQIYLNFNSGLNSSLNGFGDFSIDEYLERSYIFVSYPNGETAQYTASKV
jgi:hypothetical protein